MAKSDVAMKVWLKDKQRFADVFNGALFQGKQIIVPEDLEREDSESDIIVTDKNDDNWSGYRNRDIIMRWKKEVNLAIFAIENQAKVQHTMPVRVMLYDALAYDEQIKRLCKANGYEGDYLSAFRKNDSIYPVVSIVFYYGNQPWNTNVDLYGMFKGFNDEAVREIMLRYVSNYKINLLDAPNFKEPEIFKTDLHIVLCMLKYRQNKEELLAYIKENSRFFEKVERDTVNAMIAMLNMERIKEYIPKMEERECVNMCKAIEDLWNDAKTEGKQEGIEQGIEQGIEVTIKSCKALGATREKTRDMLVENLKITIEKAERYVGRYW